MNRWRYIMKIAIATPIMWHMCANTMGIFFSTLILLYIGFIEVEKDFWVVWAEINKVKEKEVTK